MRKVKVVAVLGVAATLTGCGLAATRGAPSAEPETQYARRPQENASLRWIMRDLANDPVGRPVCLYLLPDSDNPEEDLEVVRLLAEYRSTLLVVHPGGEVLPVLPVDPVRPDDHPFRSTQITPFEPDSVMLRVSTGLSGIRLRLGLEADKLRGPVGLWTDVFGSPANNKGHVSILRLEGPACWGAL